ncbi:MAG TPA: tetratricopeptide repeat-containing protein kinase family protein, partial [Kofleriaceae bacterium]|nr:tetratricopeptide repeat-containing protein kinase family protein [Kofleriaceae bacterium]
GAPASAGPVEPQPPSAPPESPAAAATARGTAPVRRLTAPGRFAGTPGYMATEQLAGAVVDARADQYSFCVALREALDGDRPGASATERPAAPSPPRARHEPMPAWLGELLARGMSDDPGDRFTTMDALLSELTRSRERGRRRAVMVTVAGALAITGAAALMLGGRGDPPPCPPATGELAGVWDAPARQRSAAAILATATPFAPSMWASTSAAFDQYAQRWLGAQQAACEATHVRHVQSATLLDRRMECLASRRRSLAAAAEVLMERPAQAVGHAGELLSSLGDIELCADTGVLLELSSRGGGPMAPASPVARARAAAARQRLASASALLATGDIAGADPAVAETEPIARELADDALGAEAAFLAAQVALARSDVAAATRSFDRAVELAVASHNDELIADIWLARAVHGGSIDQRPAAIEQWIGQSEAWLRRLGHPSDARRIEVERARGSLQYTAGDAHQAVATLSHAIGEAERLWGASDPRLIPMLRERAGAQARLRQARPAVADAERALALGIMAWGTSYPDIARTRRALGLLYIEQLGDVARGEQEIGLALALYRDQLGGDSIEVANCEQALSQAGQYRGDYAAALAHAERAERIYALRLGTEHPRRGEALMGLGVLRFMRRDFPGSLAAYEAALPILRAALGATHTTVGILLSNTGETLLALGRAEPARVDFAQALEILRGRLGPDHADLALPLKGLGLAQLIAGRPADARAPLERALALRTQSTAANDPQ